MRSSRRSTRSLRSRDGPGGVASGKLGSHRKARPIASASMGSDFPRVRAEARVRARGFVGTRTTRWLAVRRSCSSLLVTARTSSMAQVRSGPNCVLAQSRPAAWPDAVASTTVSARWRPSGLTATSVWVALCASTPMITMVGTRQFGAASSWAGWSRRRRVAPAHACDLVWARETSDQSPLANLDGDGSN